MASTAARGGFNPPHPNPSGYGGPKLRLPPGKGNKPVAPVDITNTGKPNAATSIAVPDLVKENAKLRTLLNEKTVEIDKLRLALQASKQQNLQLAQNNSQMLAEINAGGNRIKILKHELSCTTALLKVKGSELDRNKNTANGQQKGVKSQVLKGTASIVTVTGVDSVTSGVEHHLVESQSAISSNTVCQEPPQDGKQKRMPPRRMSSRLNQGSREIGRVSQNTLHEDTVAPLAPSTLSVQKQYGQTTGKHIEKSLQNECSATVHEVVMASGFQETEINEQPQKINLKEMQEACSRKSGDNDPHKIGDNAFNSKQSHLIGSQSAVSSNTVCEEPPQGGKQKRMPPRRMSSRLNQGSCAIGGVSQNTLHEDTVAPLAPSTLSVQKQYGQTTGKHIEKPLQNECSATLHEVVMASEFEEIEINEQPQKTNLKETQEACSTEAGVQSHKIGDKAFNSKQNHLTGSESSLSFNTVDPPEPSEDNAMKLNFDDEELGSLYLDWIQNNECHSPIEKLHVNRFDFDQLEQFSGDRLYLVELQMSEKDSSQIKRTFDDHKLIRSKVYSTIVIGGDIIHKTRFRYLKKSVDVKRIRLEEFSKVGGPKDKVLWKFLFDEVNRRIKKKAPPWTEEKQMKVTRSMACHMLHLNLADTSVGKEASIQEAGSTYCEAIGNDDVTKPKPSKKQKNELSVVDPWSASTRNTLLETVNDDLRAFPGYHKSNKVYHGKVPLTSSLNVLRNKVIVLGGRKYQIKGSTGSGAFAKVYKVTVDGNTEEMVALKIQNPSFALEFYMYCQLNLRISDIERPSFGYAHEMHIFSDVSVLVCDYLPYGTLLDVINSHFRVGRTMDEVLCMYYTIEMLNMLETLHSVGIMHGDFKPHNILVCYPSGEITEDTFRSEKRDEKNQGLCLVDWGRGIDLNLFPSPTEFHGDCGTSGFRCTEMQEHRNWTYQVDTYGLCVVVHMMLHGDDMSVVKEPRIGGGYEYRPKKPFKRYWNVDLWQKLFYTLLNPPSNDSDVAALRSLRASFREYMCSNRQLVGKLNQLLAKRKASLCSS